MPRAKPDAVLVAAFRGLTPKQVGNFRFHLRRGTRILCGSRYWTQWSDGNGGG